MSEPESEGTSSSRRPARVLLATLALLIVGFAVVMRSAYGAPSPGKKLSLDELYGLAATNQLHTVRFLDEDALVVGRYCLASFDTSDRLRSGAPAPAPPDDGAPVSRPQRCRDLTQAFHTSYPRSDVATNQLIETVRTTTGAKVEVERQSGTEVAKIVATFVLPLLMLANLLALVFVVKGGSSSVGEIAGFGRMGRKRKAAGSGTGVTFANVAGADEAVAELREVIDYLTNPGRFEALGAAPPKGVLLFGPPGCGKTLLARATAGESGVSFFSVSGTEFVESLVGIGAARVRDLFRQVREVAPAIVFIDEIDAVGRRRSGEGSSGGEREQTLNQLLVELDGFEVTAGIVLMGATNRPDILDPALLRPGRFDRHITLEAPDLNGRRAILEVHARNRPMGDDVDFDLLARRTPGFTGADLANVINEASLLAIREGRAAISASHLAEAVQRVLHGPQRRGTLLQAEERRRLAHHEAGHAIVGAAVRRAGDVHRVSITARGRGLGRSVVAEDPEHAVLTASEMRATLAVAMGGVAAEVLAFGESSTTATDDIQRATLVAREMIGLHGMSPTLGRVRLLTQEGGFLDDGASFEQMSGQTMMEFDHEVRRLIAEAEAAATAVLVANHGPLETMVARLEEQETLEGPALAELLAAVVPAPAPETVPGNGTAPPGQRPVPGAAAPRDRAGR